MRKRRKYARYQLNSFQKNNHNKLKQKVEDYPTNIKILKEQNVSHRIYESSKMSLKNKIVFLKESN